MGSDSYQSAESPSYFSTHSFGAPLIAALAGCNFRPLHHSITETISQGLSSVVNYAPAYLIFQYLIFASALCLSLAYPLEHQYYEESHGYEHLAHHEPEPVHEYGHHQLERISLGEEHGHHETPHYEVHHHEDEHVDYYVSRQD